MKWLYILIVLFVSLSIGCAHSPDPIDPPVPSVAPARPPLAASNSEAVPPESAEAPATDDSGSLVDEELYRDFVDEEAQEKHVAIADPLEPFNRAMYQFNDKLYFWLLKPVAQGYSKVVPEPVRVSVKNLFSNIVFPVRFVNCLLQAEFTGAASELGRFIVNTLLGAGGLLDPASSKKIQFAKCDGDFGQTLGVYGLGQGFYINWPIFGPSSSRDTVGMVGDFFLNPLSYVNPSDVMVGVKAYETVNDTSLRIGDYESLKEAAIDPYVAVRDAYVQYRLNKVKKK